MFFGEFRERLSGAHGDRHMVGETPTLQDVLKIYPTNSHEFLLGVAENCTVPKPVRVDMRKAFFDGPILVTGGWSAGKTDVLQMIARQMMRKRSVRVITKWPKGWDFIPNAQQHVGDAHDPYLSLFIKSQVEWAKQNRRRGNPQHRLLMIHNLGACMDALKSEEVPSLLTFIRDAHQSGITAVVSCDVYHLETKYMKNMQAMFPRRLIGHMDRSYDACRVGYAPTPLFSSLVPGVEFVYTQPREKPIQLWVPLYTTKKV